MQNALQASETESISKQVYKQTQGALCKSPIYIFDINFSNKKGDYYFLFFIVNYQLLIAESEQVTLFCRVS